MNIVEDVEIPCPHCGEQLAIEVDTTGGGFTMVEDCAVCCRPMTISVRCEPGEVQSVDIAPA